MPSASNVNTATWADIVIAGHGDHVDQAGEQKQKAEQNGNEKAASRLLLGWADVATLRVRTDNIAWVELLRCCASRCSGERKPQCGHDAASEDTSLLHSGHLVSAIVLSARGLRPSWPESLATTIKNDSGAILRSRAGRLRQRHGLIVKGKRISCPPHYAAPNNDYDPPHHDYEHGCPLIRSLRASAQRSTSVLFSFVLSLLIVAGSFAIRQSKNDSSAILCSG